MNVLRKYAHYIVAVIMFMAGIASAIASVRYIVVDAKVRPFVHMMPGHPVQRGVVMLLLQAGDVANAESC